ncbi:cysteine synthase family protein [Candidatus Babeliales bacterium]|nr:cysteine synthase family protein [Candidatus Babeliales bacterium]
MKKNKSYKTILELIGNTPLAKLELGTKPTLLAKLEYLNPGGSIKDRSAFFMVKQAEKSGLLKPGGTIIEASSGNQGIALAMIGAIKGYNVIITVPDRTSKEKVDVLRAYGAKVYVCPNTDTLDDPIGYHGVAEKLHEKIPNSFMPNQYFNKANTMAHYTTTGKEIWEQTNGTVTHAIVGAGSCGTISGVGKFLKEKNPKIKIIGVDSIHSVYSSKNPKSYDVEGIGIDVISETFNQSVVDEIIPIEDKKAFDMTKKLAGKGLLVGISSGAVVHVALQYCKKLKESDVVVIIFGDSGRAYLSKVFTKKTENKLLNKKSDLQQTSI